MGKRTKYEFKIQCKNCQKEFVIVMTNSRYENKKHPVFCSKSCSSKSRGPLKTETKEKIKNALSGRILSETEKQKRRESGMYNFDHTAPWTDELKQKMSIISTENGKLRGKKISNSLKGHIVSEETRKKLSLKNKNKPWNGKHTEEFKEKLKLQNTLLKTGVPKSEESKKKVSETLKNLIKEGKYSGGWKNVKGGKGRRSYAEEFFDKVLKNNNLYDECVPEQIFFKSELGSNDLCSFYQVDFYFSSIKFILEIDGSQHWLKEEQIKSDKERDELFFKNGFTVYRIRWNNVKTENGSLEMKNKIDKLINKINELKNK